MRVRDLNFVGGSASLVFLFVGVGFGGMGESW
jgi:hypothetical protein